MFKVYDSNYNFLFLLDKCKDIHTTEDLSMGTKNLSFKVPVLNEYLSNIAEENYIESSDYNYVIKEIVMESNDFFQVFCIANYEDLSSTYFSVFDCFQQGLDQAYQYCINTSGWTLNYQSNNKTMVTYQTANVTAWEMIKQIAADNNQEIWFDTKNKIVNVYGKMGSSLGAYYSNELYLKQLKKQSNSYEFATVLYPIGKDGLTIAAINDGKTYLTNYGYTQKRIEKYWVDENYEHAEDLKAAAEAYLEELSQPHCSYQLKLMSLGDVHLGDEIILVDKIKKIKQKQRVVKIVRYPNEPEKDSVDISNLREDFTTTYLKDKKQMKADIDYIKKQIQLLQK